MTGAQILDAILEGAFASTQRSDALTWANRKLGEIWDAEEWSFIPTHANVTVTAGSMTVTSLPTDFGVVTALHRNDGFVLVPVDEYRDFAARYIFTGSSSGLPEAFTVIDSGILVGPAASASSSTYLLMYEKTLTLLADGSTEAPIPTAYHPAIVSGARAVGYALSAPDVASRHEAEFQAAIQAMRRRYLKAMRGTGSQIPAFRPC